MKDEVMSRTAGNLGRPARRLVPHLGAAVLLEHPSLEITPPCIAPHPRIHVLQRPRPQDGHAVQRVPLVLLPSAGVATSIDFSTASGSLGGIAPGIANPDSGPGDCVPLRAVQVACGAGVPSVVPEPHVHVGRRRRATAFHSSPAMVASNTFTFPNCLNYTFPFPSTAAVTSNCSCPRLDLT